MMVALGVGLLLNSSSEEMKCCDRSWWNFILNRFVDNLLLIIVPNMGIPRCDRTELTLHSFCSLDLAHRQVCSDYYV